MRLPFNASVVNVAASSSVVGERVPCHPAVQLTDAQSGKIHFSLPVSASQGTIQQRASGLARPLRRALAADGVLPEQDIQPRILE